MADHAGAPDPRDAPQNSTATRKKFTDRFIRKLKPRSKRHDLRERAGARDGFGIRVAPSGRKTSFYLYHFGGRKRRLSLGEYPSVTLAEAYEAYGEARKLLKQHIDPGTVEQVRKIEERQAPTGSTWARSSWSGTAKRSSGPGPGRRSADRG